MRVSIRVMLGLSYSTQQEIRALYGRRERQIDELITGRLPCGVDRLVGRDGFLPALDALFVAVVGGPPLRYPERR